MSKEPLILVEDCYFLSLSKIENNAWPPRKIGTPVDVKRPDIDYWFKDTDFFVTVGGSEPQKIETVEVELPVTWRTYFLCPDCNKRINKIYLLPGGRTFKCRVCHKLRYSVTTINKHTTHGKLIYSVNRMDKLSKQREKMGTILYNGQYTRKFKSFLRQCERAGYTEAVSNATGLMSVLKELERPKV